MCEGLGCEVSIEISICPFCQEEFDSFEDMMAHFEVEHKK